MGISVSCERGTNEVSTAINYIDNIISDVFKENLISVELQYCQVSIKECLRPLLDHIDVAELVGGEPYDSTIDTNIPLSIYTVQYKRA